MNGMVTVQEDKWDDALLFEASDNAAKNFSTVTIYGTDFNYAYGTSGVYSSNYGAENVFDNNPRKAKDSLGNWVSIDSPEPQTNWAGTETRTFAITGHTEQYQDYRLLVTEDNDARSDIVVVSIASLSLKGTAK